MISGTATLEGLVINWVSPKTTLASVRVTVYDTQASEQETITMSTRSFALFMYVLTDTNGPMIHNSIIYDLVYSQILPRFERIDWNNFI